MIIKETVSTAIRGGVPSCNTTKNLWVLLVRNSTNLIRMRLGISFVILLMPKDDNTGGVRVLEEL